MPGNSQRKGVDPQDRQEADRGFGRPGQARPRGQGADAQGQGPALPPGAQGGQKKAAQGRRRAARSGAPPATPSGWPAATPWSRRCARACRSTALYVAEGAERDGRLREAFRLASERGISLLEVTKGELDRMTSGAVHQGLAARIPAYEYAHPDDLLDRAQELGEPPLVVALDQVTDPRNLGAAVRSAAAFGAHGVVIPERRAAGHDRRRPGRPAPVPRPASRWRRRSTWSASSRATRRPAAWWSAWPPTATSTLPDLDLADGPLVLVVGSEGDGLSRLVAETCDQLVSIPMANQVESLNAGVAASVALYAVAQARA